MTIEGNEMYSTSLFPYRSRYNNNFPNEKKKKLSSHG